ncbi:ABC transporter ATP-binding protein [Novispirillum itersonii]|uniref:Putative ABC transport system ATP-binding protein n=1 Tax=Novispirillum itersonii TaxID=189 RepID=A0A7W9ZIH4_NOVIT|nr:ABC transporter ATP-binding protein [Novispirillum itersonii]MBB6212122.1 putative ABC transport system ATP-binding protein [Novispirillum itersonii]
MTAAAPLIRLSALTRVYGRGDTAVAALRGIDLSLCQGDFLAIMGASGSGKSTLMNILGCLDTPSGGEYRFGAIAVETLNQTQRALLRRHRLGFVFQGFNLLARTSAQENVELPLLYRGLPAARRREAALAALDLVGLSDRAGHTPAELSGGQQQRVAIARAIVTDPAVLLADEPTGNLDTARSHAIMDLLTRLNRERGLTVIMVTHEEDMAAYAGRTLHLRDGLIDRDSGRDNARPLLTETAPCC